MIIRAVIQLD